MSTRTVRRAATALAALSVAVLATACGPENSDASGPSASAKPSSSPEKSAPTGDSPSKGASTEGSDQAGSTGGSSSGGEDAPEGDVPQCKTSQLTFKVQPIPRPINHALITATNTSGSACRLPQGEPVVTFGDLDGQADRMGPAVSQEPALEAGKSAYAGVRTSSAEDPSGDGQEVDTFHIAVNAAEKPSSVKVAGGEVYISEPAVTVWFAKADEATAY